MPDLMFRDPRSGLEQEPRHRKPTRSAVPLDLEGKTSSKLQIYACRRRSSAAC